MVKIFKNSNITIESKEEMAKLAQDIAQEVAPNFSIALYGSLGVGKSFFAKNFINYLQEIPDKVLSPTFNLVYSYNTKKGEIFHFDLYRIKHPEELENIGFFEVINRHITIIEWPEISEKYLLKNCLKITIKNIASDNSESREITINQQ